MAKSNNNRSGYAGVGIKDGKVYIAFSWRGVRCKEYPSEPATEEILKKWGTRRALILAQIKNGIFDYREWFPNGTKLSVFYGDPKNSEITVASSVPVYT